MPRSLILWRLNVFCRIVGLPFQPFSHLSMKRNNFFHVPFLDIK